MAQVQTIRAGDVKPGDRIYHPYGYCESAKWPEVTKVTDGTTTYRVHYLQAPGRGDCGEAVIPQPLFGGAFFAPL